MYIVGYDECDLYSRTLKGMGSDMNPYEILFAIKIIDGKIHTVIVFG